MKNITFSADERVIAKGRARAVGEKKTLNDAFREWLRRYASGEREGVSYRELMRQLDYVQVVDGPFTRDDMNER